MFGNIFYIGVFKDLIFCFFSIFQSDKKLCEKLEKHAKLYFVWQWVLILNSKADRNKVFYGCRNRA